MGEVAQCAAAGAPEKDGDESVMLVLVGAVVDVEHDFPGRSGLNSVLVPQGHDDCESREVEFTHRPVLQEPREHAEALSVRGGPSGPSADRTARANDLAVAGLEIRTPYVPVTEVHHHQILSWTREVSLRRGDQD